MENGVSPEDSPEVSSHAFDLDSGQRFYFVPYSWWVSGQDAGTSDDESEKRCIVYSATPGSSYAGPMKLINNIFNSDLVFSLRKEEDPSQYGETNDAASSGSQFALISAEMWLKALKRHSDAKAAKKSSKTFSAAEDDMSDVYPLQLRLSVYRETGILGVKISKKDNSSELFKRACKIFNFESQMRIWDFSGQTNFYLMDDKSKISKEPTRQMDTEILLELQIYGFSDAFKGRDGKKDEAAIPINGNLRLTNGCSTSSVSNTTIFIGRVEEAGSLGLTGLQNLGNTCFMNSAIQCLAHTPKLVDYFIEDYSKEINHNNPLGMHGEIAVAFGDLLRNLWAPGASPVSPKVFKAKLARFAPQFSGYNQHDSQELLAFLLDGLHEDLNRVKSKPYVEAKDEDGRSDELIADEYWKNHLARNDSIIVDVFQGQYKSTLVCPVCKRVSVTFDPFMYLSLPLPPMDTRSMTVTIINSVENRVPSCHVVEVPKYGKCSDLITALGAACSLRDDESLLVAEVYNSCIIRFLEDPSDSLSLIRDGDKLVAYRIRKHTDNSRVIILMHQQIESPSNQANISATWKPYGIPLIGTTSDSLNGSTIHKLYLDLLSPFEQPDISEANGHCVQETPENEATVFYSTDDKGTEKGAVIHSNEDEPLPPTAPHKRINVIVCLPKSHIQHYDFSLLCNLPEVLTPGSYSKKPNDSVHLYKCLEAFLKEEPLGPDDMWYCPTCKKHCQASKKLDLWRLPEILVIHLKRFSYTRYLKNKLESYVDFPVDDLDLSPYVSYKNGRACHRYMLYAVSNHYGSMGGGHCTALVHHGGDRWFDFDDSQVSAISLDKIKSHAAYVLFYRRVLE